MATTEHDFKGQLKYENFQFFFRRHWMRFLQPIFFTVPVGLMIIVILFVLGQLVYMVDYVFLRTFYVFFTMIVSIVFVNTFFLQIINYYFDLVILTDCRILIIRKTLFLKNNSDAIDLTKIQDIAVESHGILQNYLKYGKLVITLSTSAPPVVTSYVPDPHYYLEWANRVKREHIIQRQEKKKTDSDKYPTPKQSEYLQDIYNLNPPL
ncbi:hypothetical protein JW758_06240 [Candidatus Peregrinibacteria bacterium]|nr:hypothetical protein [Candidatus Peregrinibacteria bacterium]